MLHAHHSYKIILDLVKIQDNVFANLKNRIARRPSKAQGHGIGRKKCF
jgi:hypothetical protein